MHIVRVAISRRVEAAWPRSHKCRSAASRICSRRPTRSVGPGTDLQFFRGLLRRSHPVSCFWRPPHTAAGQRSCRSRWHSRCRRRGPVRAKIERRLPAERLQPVCLITVSAEEVPGPHCAEAKKRPLLGLSRSGLIRGRKQTSPVCQRIGTPEKPALELWPELTHRGSVSK